MRLQKGDKVKIMAGKDKGKDGVIERIFVKRQKVLIEGINIVTRHVKPGRNNEGGIIKLSKPVDVSNVMIICPNCGKTARLGYTIIDGKKYRSCKKCKEIIKVKA